MKNNDRGKLKSKKIIGTAIATAGIASVLLGAVAITEGDFDAPSISAEDSLRSFSEASIGEGYSKISLSDLIELEEKMLQVKLKEEQEKKEEIIKMLETEEQVLIESAKAREAEAEAIRVAKVRAEEKQKMQKTNRGSSSRYYDIPLTNSQQDYIRNKAAQHGLKASVVFGMFQQESNFKIDRVSGPNRNGTTDHGIGQINSVHFGKIADASRVLEFEYNVDLSLSQLAGHRDAHKANFSGEDLDRAMLNSYNMGQGGFRSNGSPLYRNHSNKIMEYAKRYQ